MPPDARLPRTRLSVPAYIDGVRRGHRATLARAITLVESERADDAAPAADLLDAILPHTGRARRIAITGVPGAGKSTLIDALGVHLVRDRGERVAVLSIDPSSPVTGGSLLGDKTRMARLAVEERAFVRPSPARGHLGGVAPRTREAILLCEAAGYDTVFVETVGVGQSEIAVREMTDCFVLLLLAGAGDELQGLKRGIVEMADILAITKADGANREPAALARTTYAGAMHLFPPAADRWSPPVLTTSALEGVGRHRSVGRRARPPGAVGRQRPSPRAAARTGGRLDARAGHDRPRPGAEPGTGRRERPRRLRNSRVGVQNVGRLSLERHPPAFSPQGLTCGTARASKWIQYFEGKLTFLDCANPQQSIDSLGLSPL